MDFVEIPPGKYVVGVGPNVKHLAIEPAYTWPEYSLATGEQMIEIDRPFSITRDLVSTHDYQRAMKQRASGPDEPIALEYLQARIAARNSGAALPRWYEWEIAVRGPEPFLYPWGNELDLAKLTLRALSYYSELGITRATAIDSFGDYARAESPFGLRQLAHLGQEWNEGFGKHGQIIRSLCDVGAMRYMMPGIRPGTVETTESRGAQPFSGPTAACYGVEQPDGYRHIIQSAYFRLVKR